MSTIQNWPSGMSITSSALGCAQDVADLSTGLNASGGAPTDDTAILNAYLATASAANPIELVLDGKVLTTGLVIAAAGYTSIRGLGPGTGIFVKAGANQDAIRLGVYTGGSSEGSGAAPSRTGKYVALRNFTINPNGGANETGSSRGFTPADAPISGAPAHAVFGICITSCTNIRLEDLNIFNPPAYCLVVGNVSDVEIVGCSFASGANLQDGAHVDGPAERIHIARCTFATGDDPIAFNCPEGYGGDITDVLVDGIMCVNSWTAARIYCSTNGGATYRARRITFRNVQGVTQQTAFNFGIEASNFTTTADQIEDLLVRDCSLTAPGFAIHRTPFGKVTYSHCVYRAPSSTTAMVVVGNPGGGAVVFDNCTILRNGDGNAAPPLVNIGLDASVSLDKLALRGCCVIDESGSSYTAIAELIELSSTGTLSRLVLDGIDMAHVTALVNDWTHVATGAVSGDGLLTTGQQIPDAQMSQWSPYISATSGLPSYKNGSGTVVGL